MKTLTKKLVCFTKQLLKHSSVTITHISNQVFLVYHPLIHYTCQEYHKGHIANHIKKTIENQSFPANIQLHSSIVALFHLAVQSRITNKVAKLKSKSVSPNTTHSMSFQYKINNIVLSFALPTKQFDPLKLYKLLWTHTKQQ